jgi:hypothetical protein
MNDHWIIVDCARCDGGLQVAAVLAGEDDEDVARSRCGGYLRGSYATHQSADQALEQIERGPSKPLGGGQK